MILFTDRRADNIVISNLEYYKVFYYVAKAGSITTAASVLNVSQPAVSQSIKQLEQQLSVSLFRRGQKGMQLSTEGKLLFSFVEKGYEQIEKGEKKLMQLQNLEFGEVRIGASDMTLQFYLLPYLERFHEKYPDIKVTVTNEPTPDTLQLLKSGKIDFAVVSTPFLEDAGLRVENVRSIEDVFVAGRRFLPYKNKTLDLQELEKLPMICLEKNTSTRSYMDSYLLQNGIILHPEFELATSDMIVQFTLRNLGIGSVVRDFVQSYIEQGLLFELRFNKMIPKRQFSVVQSNGVTHSKASLQLLEIMNVSLEA
ncbi:LysR family transcriptional regulator [Lachnospiraceae bacterium OttesenSCG-928-D06]|nr:LysR family transcriptional regulator [Lachnospiraceae bacterium OttesenSCG-928-D06]MDL2302112.1 LysR family transcriptional regulator [Lachnospiraceae bacterium OttesenSCG-928-D06]